MTPDTFTRSQWYAIGRLPDFEGAEAKPVRLLSQDLTVSDAAGVLSVNDADGRSLLTQIRYGHLWTTLSDTPRPLYDMPEFDEPDRRLVTVGGVGVRCSGLRCVENFLDMAHFPFVHTDILGVEEHPSVESYDVSMDAEKDEIWATKCKFFQPMASAAASGGQMTEYKYRVPHPYSTILYKTCPIREDVWDLGGLIIQPVEEDECIVHSFILVFDEENTDTGLLHFQQNIFLQDRMILENQVPRKLPLDPRWELPTRADASSIAYRRWLKANELQWGVALFNEAA